ncbi:hypothetical protein D6D18_09210, partial [Aureobasidium pullulans]
MSLDLVAADMVSTYRPCQQTQHIKFGDLSGDVRFIIYEYVSRNRTKSATDSPQSPTALMNTCSAGAFEMMPLYYGGAQFTLDLSRNHALRNKALDWFEKVGDIRSAHFNDVRVVCNYALELQVQVSKEKKVTVKETKGPYAQYRLRL